MEPNNLDRRAADHTWWGRLSVTVRMLIVVIGAAGAVFAAGVTTAALVGQQLDTPDRVGKLELRVTEMEVKLSSRMELFERRQLYMMCMQDESTSGGDGHGCQYLLDPETRTMLQSLRRRLQ
jgi:hypothetical protein